MAASKESIDQYIDEVISPTLETLRANRHVDIRQNAYAVLPMVCKPFYYWLKDKEKEIAATPPQGERPRPSEAPDVPAGPPTPKALLNMLPAAAKGKLSAWIENDGTYIVWMQGYLGRDLFHQCQDVLRPFGFKYISAGKQSHWELKL